MNYRLNSSSDETSISLDLSDDYHTSYSKSSSRHSEKMFFDQPVTVTRNDILEQLKELGYANVSDDIVEEFIRELQSSDSNVKIVGDQYSSTSSSVSQEGNNSRRSSHPSSKDVNSSSNIISTISTDSPYRSTRIIEISSPSSSSGYQTRETYLSDSLKTEEEQSSEEEEYDEEDEQETYGEDEEGETDHSEEHDEEESDDDSEYEADNENISSVDALGKRLQNSLRFSQQHDSREVPRSSSINRSLRRSIDDEIPVNRSYSPPRLPKRASKPDMPKVNTSNLQRPSTPQPQKANFDNSPRERARPSSALSTRSHSQTPNSARSTAPSSARYFVPRPKLTPVSYRKKVHDPVSRYQQMNKVWTRDKFLTSSKSHHGSLRWQVRKEMGVIAGNLIL